MRVIHSPNPLNPITDMKAHVVPDGTTPNQAIGLLNLRFIRPAVLVVDGRPWGRARWSDSPGSDSSLLFIEFPRGTEAYAIISLIIAVGSFIYSLFSSPDVDTGASVPTSVYDQKSIYSFSDGTNGINIGKPFVEHFGRMRVYPDLIQQSYVRNEMRFTDETNYQYLYFLGIIGTGEYDIEGVYIDNTPLTEYENSEYFIFEPGEWGIGIEGGGWDLTTAVYSGNSFDVGSQTNYPYGLFFKPDGTKMYIIDWSDTHTIYQYSLSSAWNTSTISYDSVSFDTISQESAPTGIFFNSDGSKMYILGFGTDTVYQYTLSTPWVVSSASYDSVSFSVSGQGGNPSGLFFNSDGTKMYTISANTSNIYQYTLSTGWNLSTASYDSVSFDVSGQEDPPMSLFFKPDGTKVYIIGYDTSSVHQYTLSTPWVVSSASYDSISFNVGSQEVNSSGLFFKPDGTKIYTTGFDTYTVYEYMLSSFGTGVENIVWTCNELATQEIGYDDWITYIISAPQTEIEYIEYDVVFQNGLYYTGTGSDQETIYSSAAKLYSELRTVDDSGAPTSEWDLLDSRIQWGSSRDPLRFTYRIPARYGIGRYQVRFKRLETDFDEPLQSNVNGNTSQNTPTLTGLRGYGPSHLDYGDVTVLFARIKATDQLNGNVTSQVNVVATRKLGQVTDTGISGTLTATRSIIDAIGHMVTDSNCGNQSDSLVDWEALAALRATFEASEYYFDHRFTSRVSVMDAAAMAAACGRAVPYMPGGMFSVVQDVDQEVPTCVFTDDNITDLSIITNPRTADSPTCVNVKYINPDTWDEETVSCYDGYGSEDLPTEITLTGSTSRQQAYELGMFLYLQSRYERTSVSFTTNAAGYIPQLLSKILVPNKMTNWGSSGLIVKVDGSTIWLSEPVDFDGETTGLLYITLEDGTAGGPYTVTPTESAHAVIGSIPVLNTLSADGLAATRFLFGVDTDEKLLVRVNNISPQGRDSVKISGTIVAHEVYADPGEAPEIGGTTWDQDLLDSVNLIYTGEDSSEHQFNLVWSGDADSVRIELDEGDSSGYVILEDQYTDYGYQFSTAADTITVKVTPYDGAVIHSEDAREVEWNYEESTVGEIENLTFPSLSNVSTVRTVAFTNDALSIVEWGPSQEQGGVLVYTVNDPPTGDDDYTIRDNNKVVLNPTKWQNTIEANILGLLNVNTRQGA